MKKGFTLVELMAVIAILAILAIIAVPTYNVVSERIKQSTYESKVQNIIAHSESYAENTNTFVFDVGTLIEQGLLEADNEAGEYLDPRNGRDMRCDIINVVFENNQYVASVTESDTCYTDEELQNLFGMFEIVIYRPDGTKVEPIPGTDWIREQDIVLKYELKDEYKDLGYEDNITQIIWSGEQEKVCEENNLGACEGYDIHTEVIKNVTVNLQINIKINGSIVISRTNKKVLVDLESPRVDNIVTGTDLNEQEMNRTEFDLSDGNGSGVKYYAVLPSTGTCSGAEYEAARKNINGNHVVEYLDSGDHKICVEDNVGNKGEGSVSLSEINFDPNGGTLEIDKKVIGTNTSYGVMPTPTREYYHFLGWFTEKEGGTQVTPDTVLTEDTTVYAHWQIYTYTVTYNPNGGSVSPTSEVKDHGSQYGAMPTPTRNNYRFLGWFTEASGGTQITSTSIVTGDITLYAHWELIAFTVTYNYQENGGSSATKTNASVTVGSKVDLTPTATKSGYEFIGWNTNANATSGLSSYTMGSGNVTLYAIYRKTILITLIDMNGSSKEPRAPISLYAYNKNTSASLTMPSPRPFVHAYCGYNDSRDIIYGFTESMAATATVQYKPNTTYTFSRSTTLYALYRQTTAIYLGAIYNGIDTLPDVSSPEGFRYLNAYGNANALPNTSKSGVMYAWNNGYFKYSDPTDINGYWTYTFYASCPNQGRHKFTGWICYPNNGGRDYYGDPCYEWGNWNFTLSYKCSMNYDCTWD